ncbi:MAG: hypothetical protein K8F54_00290 [Altibacter sp.]|uniref:hypothetical protein n=1 Tax=Altibacter sp. TaxID=2024823 RepID=UPI001D7FA44E|nr:hypothetical protein [Altibacter sp.]MBZ0326016.1 hypothetical protein [Altibacter sp.]
MKPYFLALLLLVSFSIQSQETGIAKWFSEDLKANIGRWEADNSPYVSEEEPYETYVMEWSWGIGKTSIIGRLFGVKDGQETGDFWEYRQYWDNVKQAGMLLQFGQGGVIGIGKIQPMKNGSMEAIQTFSMPNGTTWITKHDLSLDESSLQTTSYDKDTEGNWIEKRTYTWVKQ